MTAKASPLESVGHQDGMAIRLERVSRRMTVTELAHHLGISRQYLRRIELNQAAISLGLLIKTAGVFGKSVDTLIDESAKVAA